MPGETPIDTVSISTPLAAKKPFLVATIPGQVVASAILGRTTLWSPHAPALHSAPTQSDNRWQHNSQPQTHR